jgi:alpha-mannosidase
MRRSEVTATLLIDTFVTLRAGADHLELRTVIDNNVRDHRIRVLFESGAKTDTYLADSAFDVVERKIALPPDNYTYQELAVETTPQAGWTAVFDDQRGLAVVAPSLPETTVRDLPVRPLTLTLLRAFRRTVFTDGEEGGQSLGRHEVHYRLVPLAGEPPRTRLAQLAQQTVAGVRAVQVLPRTQAATGDRTLPRTLGQLSLKPGRAIISALRRRPDSDSLELRIYNVYDESISETLAFHRPVASAALTDFEGNEQSGLKINPDGTVALSIPPRKIATVLVSFAAE